jgi:hypothetical protein
MNIFRTCGELETTQQAAESFCRKSVFLRHTPEYLWQLPDNSGTRRNCAVNCRNFPEIRRNHSGTEKSFKNPNISMISSKSTLNQQLIMAKCDAVLKTQDG